MQTIDYTYFLHGPVGSFQDRHDWYDVYGLRPDIRWLSFSLRVSRKHVASAVSSKVFSGHRAVADTVRFAPKIALHVDATLYWYALRSECQTHKPRKKFNHGHSRWELI